MKRSFADDLKLAAEEALSKGESLEVLNYKIYSSNGAFYISKSIMLDEDESVIAVHTVMCGPALKSVLTSSIRASAERFSGLVMWKLERL